MQNKKEITRYKLYVPMRDADRKKVRKFCAKKTPTLRLKWEKKGIRIILDAAPLPSKQSDNSMFR